MADWPLCAFCHVQPVRTRQNIYCSIACAHEVRKVLRPFCQCGCGKRLTGQQKKYRNKQHAWKARGGIQIAAEGRQKALAVNRAKYAARLREKLLGLDKKSAIWNAAYRRGYGACYQSFLRQIRRGDIIVVRERKMRKEEAA